MSDFRKYLNKKLKDPAFKKEWNELDPEYNLIRSMIMARKKRHITQKQLATITGIDQADISKIENGTANPALSTLKRLADGLDMILKVDFVPKHAKI
jgi:transcriptional regulator with XRE-family HTH domain